VVCHVLDHLREEGPHTTKRRFETVKALLSRDVQSNIAPASSERYGITSQQYEVLKLQRALKQDPMVQPS
ncbi:hypothetical protein HID58_022816, partial [Brassica napus]